MLYIFDKDDKLLEIIEDFYDDEMERELNSDWTYNFKIDINISKNIKKPNKVGFFDDDKFYLFLIEEVNDTMFSEDVKSVYCINDIYSINAHIIEDKRCVDYSIDKSLEKALEGTDYVVGEVDTFNNNTVSFYYISSLSAVKKIIETYQAEYMPRIEYDEETDSLKKYIDVKVKIGKETGLRFTYDTNISEIKRNESTDNHYTVLYGRGASLPITDEEGEETGGYTRLIDFSEVEWSKENGNQCDKPLGQKYVEDTQAIQKYGRIEGIYENKDIESTSELLQATYEALQETKEINVSYEVSVEDLSNIEGFEHYKYSLGDRIIILDDDYDINLESRIIKEKLSLKNKTKVVTLGYIFPSMSSNNASSIVTGDEEKEKPEDKFSDEDFPNTLPSPPVLSIDREGFASISLSWTFENKPYYIYELYASQSENFNPTENHLIWRGHGSAFLHEVNFNQTWYYRARVTNSHGQSTEFSNQVSATTYKIDDATEIFEKAAIKEALIESLNADKIIAGKVKGTFIDARNLSVEDGNGNITFLVSSEGLVKLIQGLISIDENGIKINLVDSEGTILGYVLYDGQGVQIFDTEGNDPIAYFTREGSYIQKCQIDKISCYQLVQVATRNGCPKTWYVSETQTGDGSGRDENNKACSIMTVLKNIKQYGIFYLDRIDIYIQSGYIKESIVIQDFYGTVIKFHISKGVVIEVDKFTIEDCSARIWLEGDTNEVLATDEEITSEEINSRALIKTNVSKLFNINNCNYINISGLVLRGIGNGYVAEVFNASKVIIKDCDFSNFDSIFYTDDLSQTVLGVSRGNVKNLSYIGWGGLFTSTSQIPKYSDENMTDLRGSGIHHTQSSYIQYDTLYKAKETENVSSNKEASFELTNLYTTVEGDGKATTARKGYVGQGKYQSYKAHRGHATIPTSDILEAMEGKINPVLKLVLTRLNTSHGYNSETPHPIIRTKGTSTGATTSYWDTNTKFARGAEKTITLDDSIVNGIKKGATELEFWADSNQNSQYSFYNNLRIIVEGENTITEDPIDMTAVVFSGADELVEVAMTYWRHCDDEYDGTAWSQGLTYRSSNTPMSGECEATQDTKYSLWVNCNGNHYKAIDCSTLANSALKGYSYEEGPYSSKEAFEAFRKDRLQKNNNKSWTLNAVKEDGTLAREAASIAEFFYNQGWIIPLEKIGDESDNYSGLNVADFVFMAKKNSDGTWKRPDRFMKISHVAIVKGVGSDGDKQFIESTNNTVKKHTVGSKEYNAGVIIRAIKNASPETIVLVGRIKG